MLADMIREMGQKEENKGTKVVNKICNILGFC